MTERFNSSIVRIRAANEKEDVIGSGFLIPEKQVVTCGHVIAKALGLPEYISETPQAGVCLDFPFIAAGRKLIGHVVCWQPPRPDGSGDVAVLKLDGEQFDGAQTVELVRADKLWGHPFKVYGFPPGAGHDDGVWSHGKLLERQAAGWVIIENDPESEFRVGRGFSGAPVWDEELKGVVGMVVASEKLVEIRAAFILPASMLANACPEIKQALITKPRIEIRKVSQSYTLAADMNILQDHVHVEGIRVKGDVNVKNSKGVKLKEMSVEHYGDETMKGRININDSNNFVLTKNVVSNEINVRQSGSFHLDRNIVGFEQLANNIRQDRDLLKDHEDKLRYETDPRKRARYRRDIERQRESLARNLQEYDEITKSAQDVIKSHPVPENELQDTLNAVQQTLSEIRESKIGQHSPQLVSEVKKISEIVDDPKLDSNHKLKYSIPIIPLILSYEGEVELKSGLNLKKAWQSLKARLQGK